MKSVILIAVLSAFLAVAGAIFVGVRTFDGPVAEHPYEEGLAWDEVHRKNEELGWSMRVNTNNLQEGYNEMTVFLTDPWGSPLADASLSVTISRPAAVTHDAIYAGVPVKEGTFSVPVSFPLYGYWDMKVAVIQRGVKRIFRKRIFVGKGEGAQ